jgi:hypothetical protein
MADISGEVRAVPSGAATMLPTYPPLFSEPPIVKVVPVRVVVVAALIVIELPPVLTDVMNVLLGIPEPVIVAPCGMLDTLLRLSIVVLV